MIMKLRKRADIQKNRIIIPKWFIDKYGREFVMEIYIDRITLYPLQKD